MVYALFTDSTFRSSNHFTEQFENMEAFENACSEVAGDYDGKVISQAEYLNLTN